MKDVIRIIIGIAIVLMALSSLLGSFLLVAVFLPTAPAYAQTPAASFEKEVQSVTEEALPPLPAVTKAQQFSLPAGERLVVPEATAPLNEEDITVTAFDLAASLTPAAQARQGTLGVEEGGFSENVWQGVSRRRAELLLERVRTQGLRSESAQGLLRRLLLSMAEPPEGPQSQHWLALRARTLQTMGFAQDAHFLLNRVSSVSLGVTDLDQVRVDGLFLLGEKEKACTHVRENIRNTDVPYWQHALLVCHALSGGLDKLGLAVKLATAQEKGYDPLLYGILDAILTDGASPRLAVADVFSPLHVALYQSYPRLINPDVMRRLPDVTLRRVVQTASLDISLRLQAAEKLVNDFNTPEDVAILVGLYEAVPFTPEAVEAPVGAAQQEIDGSKARALLWQAAGATAVPSGKALALKLLWQRAEQDTLINLPARLLPEKRNITPEKNLAWFSPYVIKMALRGARLDVAQAWWAVLSGNRSLSRDLTVERTDIAMAFALLDGHLEENILDQWWATQPLHSQENRLKVTRILALMEALNLTVPAEFWKTVHKEFNDAHTQTYPGPGPVWLRLVGSALEEDHVGEALLMLLEPLMYAQADNLPPQGVANIAAGLVYLGLAEDAKKLALEAMIGGGSARR